MATTVNLKGSAEFRNTFRHRNYKNRSYLIELSLAFRKKNRFSYFTLSEFKHLFNTMMIFPIVLNMKFDSYQILVFQITFC